MKKKLAFLTLALGMMAVAQTLTPTTAEAASCGLVCPPHAANDCVCCEWCCTTSGGGLTCSDRPCFC
jgi:hypothetical protein